MLKKRSENNEESNKHGKRIDKKKILEGAGDTKMNREERCRI